MEKDVFMRYVQLLHRFEELSKEEHSIYSNTIEAKTILEVRQLVENNQELLELLKKIHSLPDSEREKAVEEYFSKQNKKEEQEEQKKSEEEEIAKTFGVNVNEIDHKYLKNGNEIFSFYDNVSNRQVVLENNKKGKSLLESLQDIQKQNEKYQTEDEYDNSKNILRDKSSTENIELKFYTRNEIINLPSLDNIRGKDALILTFLLKHYDELGIKGINLDNLIYLDSNNIIQEAVVVNDKVIVGEPDDAKSNNAAEASNEAVKEEVEEEPELTEEKTSEVKEEPKESNNEELNEMMEESKEEVKEEDKKNEKEKPKTLIRNIKDKIKDTDSNGFINNVLFISIATGAVLLIALVVTIIKYYA